VGVNAGLLAVAVLLLREQSPKSGDSFLCVFIEEILGGEGYLYIVEPTRIAYLLKNQYYLVE
jgi:hypothetical protein